MPKNSTRRKSAYVPVGLPGGVAIEDFFKSLAGTGWDPWYQSRQPSPQMKGLMANVGAEAQQAVNPGDGMMGLGFVGQPAMNAADSARQQIVAALAGAQPAQASVPDPVRGPAVDPRLQTYRGLSRQFPGNVGRMLQDEMMEAMQGRITATGRRQSQEAGDELLRSMHDLARQQSMGRPTTGYGRVNADSGEFEYGPGMRGMMMKPEDKIAAGERGREYRAMTPSQRRLLAAAGVGTEEDVPQRADPRTSPLWGQTITGHGEGISGNMGGLGGNPAAISTTSGMSPERIRELAARRAERRAPDEDRRVSRLTALANSGGKRGANARRLLDQMQLAGAPGGDLMQKGLQLKSMVENGTITPAMGKALFENEAAQLAARQQAQDAMGLKQAEFENNLAVQGLQNQGRLAVSEAEAPFMAAALEQRLLESGMSPEDARATVERYGLAPTGTGTVLEEPTGTPTPGVDATPAMQAYIRRALGMGPDAPLPRTRRRQPSGWDLVGIPGR